LTARKNILVQTSKIFPTIYPIYGVNPSINLRCVGDIPSETKKWENETCERVKWLKGAKPEGLEVVFVIWIGQGNEKMEQQLMKLRNKRK
jgi:hypothetical protein